MPIQLILWPGVAMVALTFMVMAVMYRRRIGQMQRERIHPQSVATAAQSAARLTDSNAADNFRNLFELPVLFYFAIATAALTGQVTTTTLSLAWAFVALRTAHSVVQCTYNKVMHRFKIFMFGAVVLLLLWLRLGYGLLAA